MFNRRPSGFTLLELLVVISIIAILAVSLTPAFSRAREAGRRSVCSDNMKQCHYSITMYEQEYGVFPTRSQGTANQYTSGDAQEALNLLYRQYTDDVRIFSCPSKPLAPSMLNNILPSSATGRPGSSGTAFRNRRRARQVIRLRTATRPGHNSSNSRVVIIADHQGTGPKGNSDNHGKDAGQNTLSAGGAVQFTNDKKNTLGKDDNGQDVIDNDVFTYNTIQPSTYLDWDSVCR